ncbi:MAG: carbamoyltransferase HypF [Planctomycetes bacterium]|nr:carbamoyltransferase HypF [Planctomycetota bacterium]
MKAPVSPDAQRADRAPVGVAASAGLRIRVTGAVQGVGFRPFVHGLAVRQGLGGWVANEAAAVEIEVHGPADALDRFLTRLRTDAPSLARIDAIATDSAAPRDVRNFVIRRSGAPGSASQPVPPDAGMCTACRGELLDPTDRRFRHAFINCTDCGPRFTIVAELPWDRARTTMAAFPMCHACLAEYADPRDRRFHAEPVACPQCGPRAWLESADGTDRVEGDRAFESARALLAAGRIVAVKGIGGVHLACDAANESAVAELRLRKCRSGKPFAVLVRDVADAERIATVSPEERRALTSSARPIVLLARRPDARIAAAVAPGRDTLGVMLPSTPVHELLLAPAPGDRAGIEFDTLVLTSGNVADEPLVILNSDARARLSRIADALLLHDRDISTRADDSVVRMFEGREMPIRRSRGYAPLPVALPFDVVPLTATGAELKTAFCVARGRSAYVGPHVGDVRNWETLVAFDDAVRHCESLLRVQPRAIAHDMHPDFLTTRWALDRAARDGLRAIGVQHHHAHAAACIVENGLGGVGSGADVAPPVIAVTFDGAGFGTDGAIWGGEFLVASVHAFERFAHLAYVPLPGGDAAVAHPWRMALAWLRRAGVDWSADLAPVEAAGAHGLAAVDAQIRSGSNAPRTSSIGRLFDAVASIAGVRQDVSCEGQAAIELEIAARATGGDGRHGAYPVPAAAVGPLDLAPLVAAVADDVRRGVTADVVSARFHESVARLVHGVCIAVRNERGHGDVVLTGGVFQNLRLLGRTSRLLRDCGFQVHSHHVVPANDGGIALGQAAVAGAVLRTGG